jgi:hypothetical protein
MSEDLTLSMDSDVIKFANNYSQKNNKSLSKIIEDYFIDLRERNTTDLPEDLQELYGIFEGIDVPDKKELRGMFHESKKIKSKQKV